MENGCDIYDCLLNRHGECSCESRRKGLCDCPSAATAPDDVVSGLLDED